MIYLFVLDDSLTSKRFTMRTEQLTKCCELLQHMKVRLEVCKIDISDLSKAKLLLWFYLFCVLESNFCAV